MSVNRNNNGTLQKIAGGTLYADVPLGIILPFGGAFDKVSTGFLPCDGRAVSRTTYKDLFAVIGTNFGVGDGSTTFNVPDMQGEYIRGAGTNSHSGQGDGGSVGQHQDATRVLYEGMDASGQLYVRGSTTVSASVKNADYETPIENAITYIYYRTESSSASTPTAEFAVRPTSTCCNFVIKAFKTGVPADFDGQDIYSTAERRVGTWIDGSPVYERVILFESDLSVSATSWTETSVDNGNMKDIVNCLSMYIADGAVRTVYPIMATINKTAFPHVALQTTRNASNDTISGIIIRYTKTTD